jgi:hypothetical protein
VSDLWIVQMVFFPNVLSWCSVSLFPLKLMMVVNQININRTVYTLLWDSVLLVEETGGPGENHWHVASHWQSSSHNVVHLALFEIRTHISFVIMSMTIHPKVNAVIVLIVQYRMNVNIKKQLTRGSRNTQLSSPVLYFITNTKESSK